MKTIVLEYFNIFGKKQNIILNNVNKEKILREGIKIDSSDILGLLFICDTEFILRPIWYSVKEYNHKEVYLCRVYDEQERLLDNVKDYWIKRVKEETIRLGELFIQDKNNY